MIQWHKSSGYRRKSSLNYDPYSTLGSGRQKELQSLAGHPQHAASVVRPGYSFIRCLYDLQATVSKPHHLIHLSVDKIRPCLVAYLHVTMERRVLPLRLLPTLPMHIIRVRRLWQLGSGAVWQHHWFQLPWGSRQEKQRNNIVTLELYSPYCGL